MIAYHDTKLQEIAPYPDALELLRDLARPSSYEESSPPASPLNRRRRISAPQDQPLHDFQRSIPDSATGSASPSPIQSSTFAPARPSESCLPKPCISAITLLNDIDPPKSLGMITVLNRRSGKYAQVTSLTGPDYQCPGLRATSRNPPRRLRRSCMVSRHTVHL